MGVKLGVSTLTLWKEHRLRVFKNKVLRIMFEPMMKAVTGGYRKIQSEKLHHLYALPNIITMIKYIMI